jgi:hypothetical protein
MYTVRVMHLLQLTCVTCCGLVVAGALCAGQSVEALERESRRGRDLDHAIDALNKSAAMKDGVTAEVIAGRLTVRQAAQRFRDSLQGIRPLDGLLLQYSLPGSTEEERMCRWVVASVKAALEDLSSSSAASLVAEMESELAVYEEHN